MTTYTFPALGFDPAPGDPDAVGTLARDCGHAATDLATDADHLTARDHADVWAGQAADAARSDQATLARDLASAAGAFATAGAALVQFTDHLTHAQAAARVAEDQAAVAQTQLKRLTAQLQDLDQELTGAGGGTDVGSLDGDREAVRRAWAAAQSDYDAAVATAHAIQAELEAAGDAAASALHAIPGAPYQPPNLFQQAWDRIESWVDDHADALHQLSDGLKLVSAVAGVLSFIPVLTPIMAPIATATAITALAIDAVLVVTGNGSVKALLVDGALMALPGAGRIGSRLWLADDIAPTVVRNADAALKMRPRGIRPKSVAVLKTRNFGRNQFEGASRPAIPEGQMHPRVQRALDNVPIAVRSEFHGSCGEIKAVNDALSNGARLDDSVVLTRYARGPGNLHHGQPHPPCTTCEHVLKEFNIRWFYK